MPSVKRDGEMSMAISILQPQQKNLCIGLLYQFIMEQGVANQVSCTLDGRWMANDTEYDIDIAKSMTHSRYKQLKSVFKLNNNMTDDCHQKRTARI
jgi:hypothetical protein